MNNKNNKSAEEYLEELRNMYKLNPDANSDTSNFSTVSEQANNDEKSENLLHNEQSLLPEENIPDLSLFSACKDETTFNVYGILKIKVSTAESALPLENATVIITCMHNNKYNLAGVFFTDNSGEIKEIPLPAPKTQTSSTPNIKNPSALYDLTIKKDGYFTVDIKDVPIFENITSIQNINLIPLPAFSDQENGDVIYNSFSTK